MASWLRAEDAMPWRAGEARVSWWGHATVLIDDGARILTDPILTPGLAHLIRLRGLDPHVDNVAPDAVVISHLHADHMHVKSLRLLPESTKVVVPRGAGVLLSGTHLDVIEVEVGDEIAVRDATITVTQARHDGRRWHGSRMWAPTLGYVIGGRRQIYFAGDTALFDGLAEIRDLTDGGPDLALLPVWGWGPWLRGEHLNPESAAEALELVRPKVAVPIHWGTFWPRGMSRVRQGIFADAGAKFAEHARKAHPATEVRVLTPGSSTVV
jgi:L-ascorbate metabolism protein UlaG (beta-lactamase superfamily)